MAADRSYIAENDRERRRLETLVTRLDDATLGRAMPAGWTVAGVLAHLAFWDQRIVVLCELLKRGAAVPVEAPGDVDWINDAAKPAQLALPPRRAAALAVETARAADEAVAMLADDLLARNAAAGSPINLRRAEHRREHLDEIEHALARARSSDRVPKLLAWAALGLVTVLGPTAAVEAQSSQAITVTNALPTSTVCPGGNTVSVFAPQQQVIQPGGNSIRLTGDFSSFPGLGIQVNNWYWTSIPLPVQSGNPQDPDNSGAQFSISSQCALAQQPAWYGKGIPTYLIATVTAAKTIDGCTIAIVPNAYTNAVTPGCCAPPGIGSNTCAGPWGVTSTGQPWPPK